MKITCVWVSKWLRYRSIQQDSFPSGSNPSINYLEVAFSPQNQINDDIIAQIGDFNLGEYIGDPRQVSESKNLINLIKSCFIDL